MKHFLILILSLLITACGESEIETRYYPTGDGSLTEDLITINLDTTQVTVREIIYQIGDVQNRGETPVIQFTDDEIQKNIIPILTPVDQIPPENKLIIRSESLIREQVLPNNRLKPVLKQHYAAVKDGPSSPADAIVVIAVDPERTAAELRHVLRNLTRTFDEVNAEIEEDLNLYVLFDYFSPTPPPPPPPAPVEE